MILISATAIKVGSVMGLFRFILASRKVLRQLKGAEGLVFAKARGFRTLSGWESREAMNAFRNNGHHLTAMKFSRSIGKVKSVTWESEFEPDWNETKKRLHDVDWIA
jgi:hypothetical protein